MTSVKPPQVPIGGSSGSKPDFNAMPPPPNYVPGLGRGATGFTTRSDIGPARFAPDVQPQLAGQQNEGKDGGDEAGAQAREEFDEFMGNDAGALAAWGEYDEDDKEADKVWESIDDFMDERRRERREQRLKEEIEKFRAENPKITEQFRDLKRRLAEVSDDEWNSIPDIGDYTIKNKPRFQSFAPVPDTLLAKAVAEKQTNTYIDPSSGLATPALGTQTPGTASTVTDLTAMGTGGRTVLELKLDRYSDSVTGQTVVDPKGYLTDLRSVAISSETDISDIKKVRHLLKSLIQTNPKQASGWIAAARLEEKAGKLQEARRLIQKGVEMCPSNEDVWCEAARLQTPEMAKALLARGVAANPLSVKLWLQAARLEQDGVAKSRVLRKALERIPTSVRLWKAAVELANEDDARVLLSRAVECCPQHVELWLALARLETYEKAKKVLNQARKAVPTERAVWITAAKLEEANGNGGMADKIIDRAIRSLQTNGVVVDRETWLQEAQNVEKSKPAAVATCRAIVKAVIGHGVEMEDRKRTWLADAEESVRHGAIETARAIYEHCCSVFPDKKGVWRRAAMFEKSHGTRESLENLLAKAVGYCPQAEVLWLMFAKEKWLAGDIGAAREILDSAFRSNRDSEEILLAAFKLEFESNEPERARVILARARQVDSAATARVWMKSAIVERRLGDIDEERRLLNEGLQKFPGYAKLWLMLGQLEQRLGNHSAAQQAYGKGLQRCIDSVPLWISAARLEEDLGNLPKARAVLEQARLRIKACDVLWLAAVRLELRHDFRKEADKTLARALQDCPNSGLLWAEKLRTAARHAKKSVAVDAYKRCSKDPHAVAACADYFCSVRKMDKARSWFNLAVTLDPDIGDHWAMYYAFESQHGTAEDRDAVLSKAVAAEPHHGERWTFISKNPANANLTTAEILKKVVLDFEARPYP